MKENFKGITQKLIIKADKKTKQASNKDILYYHSGDYTYLSEECTNENAKLIFCRE